MPVALDLITLEPAKHSTEPSGAHIDFAQIETDLDRLEARMRKDLRSVIMEWRDALAHKITKAANGDGLSKLAGIMQASDFEERLARLEGGREGVAVQ